MKKNLHPIDEIFLEGLSEKQNQPSLAAWDAIEKSLDQNIASSYQQKYVKLQKILIALLLLLAFVSIYFIQSYKKLNSSNTVIKTPSVANEKTHLKEASVLIHPKPQKPIVEKTSSPSLKDSETKNVAIIKTDNYKTKATKTGVIKNLNENKTVKTSGQNITNEPTKITKNSYPIKIKKLNTTTSIAFNKEQYEKNTIKESNKSLKRNLSNNFSNTTNKTKLKSKEVADLKENIHFEMAQIESKRAGREPSFDFTKQIEILLIEMPTAIVKEENTIATIVLPITKIKSPKIWSITPNLSLNTLNTRIVTGEDLGSRREYLRKQITESETAKLGVSFGVGLEVNLTKRISLESGINYFEKNTTIKPRTIAAERDREGKIKYRFDCSAGTYYIDPKLGTTISLGDSTKSVFANNKLQYINTPIIAKYQLVTGKINWFQMVGVGANVLVGQSFETSFDNNLTENLKNLKTSDLKNIYFNAIVGAGIDYNISKKIAIRFVPTYRFSITPMNKNEAIKTFPNSFSATTGLKIGL